MALTFTQINAAAAQACDGALGFTDGTDDYILGGWTSGTGTLDAFWKSTNNGVSFAAQTAFAYPAHTFASAKKGNVLYVVGGDVYSPINSGGYIKSSKKFEGGAWVSIAADCGIANRCIGQLVCDGTDFYYFGGQQGELISSGVYHTVLKSTDNCATFTSILADTTPYFTGGLLWGAVVYFKGLFWKIGGAMYDSNPVIRTYVTKIYSSSDAITWTFRGNFKGIGRHYHQCVVYNNKIRLIGGYNMFYGNNIGDVWTIDWDGTNLTQVYEGTVSFTPRHAHTAWVSADGILVFGGTDNDSPTINNDLWLITEA